MVLGEKLQLVINAIKEEKRFGDPTPLLPLLQSITDGGDYYLLSNDFDAYLSTQERIDRDYLDKKSWWERSIRAASGMGLFSSDRCIREYAEGIWGIKPIPNN